MFSEHDEVDPFVAWEMRNGTGSTTLWTVAYQAPRFSGPGFRRMPISSEREHERRLARAYVRGQEKARRETQALLDGLATSAREAAAKAQRSREAAAKLASDSLHGVQPRNAHHRSLRGYSDAPRRPVYRGAR